MFTKIFLAVALVASFSFNAFSEEAKKEEKPYSFLNYKDNLVLALHTEHYLDNEIHDEASTSERGSGKLQHLSQFYMPVVGYKIYKNLSLVDTLEFKGSRHGRVLYPSNGKFDYFRSLVGLTLSNVLTEKEYGVQVDLGLARRLYNTTLVPTTRGNNRINIKGTKNWGNNNFSLFAQYLRNDYPVATESNKTWDYTIELIPTLNLELTSKLSFTATDDFNISHAKRSSNPNSSAMSHELSFAIFTYKFNDNYSTYAQFKYNHAEDFTAKTLDLKTNFEYYLGAIYNFNPKTMITGEISSDFLASNDGQVISKGVFKPRLGVFFDVAY
jgi:hypothetical protein